VLAVFNTISPADLATYRSPCMSSYTKTTRADVVRTRTVVRVSELEIHVQLTPTVYRYITTPPAETARNDSVTIWVINVIYGYIESAEQSRTAEHF